MKTPLIVKAANEIEQGFMQRGGYTNCLYVLEKMLEEQSKEKELKSLSEENTNLKCLLDEATTWLAFGTPEPPDHQCGTDSSCCDGLCQNYANYCEFTTKVRKVLKDFVRP